MPLLTKFFFSIYFRQKPLNGALMATAVLRGIVPLKNAPKLTPLQLYTRGLKKHQLFKKKKTPKVKQRDGWVYTVDHLYWERHFEQNPEILLERRAMNIKGKSSTSAVTTKSPMNPAEVLQTLKSGDKKLAVAAVTSVLFVFFGVKIAML